jgi:hypothetical protein
MVRHWGDIMQFLPAIERIMPDTIVDLVFAIRMHKEKLGVFPKILKPETFNEKILRRKLLDRRKILTQFADKYRVREYVENRLGPEILTKLYFVTTNPADIPFDELPDKFVVKPSHGSGWFKVVADKSKLNKADLRKTCISWLNQSFYRINREWAYKNIEPRILIEEFIDDGSKGMPIDYKLYVFHGKVEILHIIAERHIEIRLNFYDRFWNQLDAAAKRFKKTDKPVKRPKHLDEMIRAAEILGDGIDFLRIDFYDTEEKVYFGEITITPSCGWEGFTPREFDRYLGGFW